MKHERFIKALVEKYTYVDTGLFDMSNVYTEIFYVIENLEQGSKKSIPNKVVDAVIGVRGDINKTPNMLKTREEIKEEIVNYVMSKPKKKGKAVIKRKFIYQDEDEDDEEEEDEEVVYLPTRGKKKKVRFQPKARVAMRRPVMFDIDEEEEEEEIFIPRRITRRSKYI